MVGSRPTVGDFCQCIVGDVSLRETGFQHIEQFVAVRTCQIYEEIPLLVFQGGVETVGKLWLCVAQRNTVFLVHHIVTIHIGITRVTGLQRRDGLCRQFGDVVTVLHDAQKTVAKEGS